MLQNYAKGRDRARESRIDYDQCSELCKGRIRESRTGYGQCTMQRAETENAEEIMVNALCKGQRQRTQNRLWSMHYAKGRDSESRTVYSQHSERYI